MVGREHGDDALLPTMIKHEQVCVVELDLIDGLLLRDAAHHLRLVAADKVNDVRDVEVDAIALLRALLCVGGHGFSFCQKCMKHRPSLLTGALQAFPFLVF